MRAYCIDTSGLSTPLEYMPEDIHRTLWREVIERIEAGMFAATAEIYDELTHIENGVGDCIRNHKTLLQLEVGEDGWDSLTYIDHATRMQTDHASVISEYNGNRKSTVGLNDLSIVALGRPRAAGY